MPGLGVRLQLSIGETVPRPAPYAVMDSLVNVEVTNKDEDFDGFRISFSLGKDSLLDYGLLMSGLLDPPSRVTISVFITLVPEVLIDGIITRHQVIPSNKPGESMLHVFGKDISTQLDLEEKDKSFPNQSDSAIVTSLIRSPSYENLGLVPRVTPTTDVPVQTDRIPSQQGTDFDFITRLARRNGFVFYIEPGAPGVNTAHWGVEDRRGDAQHSLDMNMGSETNVDNPITLDFDALGPSEPQVSILDPLTKFRIPIPLPASLYPPLVKQQSAPLRRTLPRNTANLSALQAALHGGSSAGESADAVTASGEIDAARYGRVLKARRLVSVAGVGRTHDGDYYVKEVTHHIKRGEYKQSFTLTREGRGASRPTVQR